MICLQTDESKVKGSFNGLLDRKRKFWIDDRILVRLQTNVAWASNFSYAVQYKQ